MTTLKATPMGPVGGACPRNGNTNIIFLGLLLVVMVQLCWCDSGPSDYSKLDPCRSSSTPLYANSTDSSMIIALQNALAGATYPIQPSGTAPSGDFDSATSDALLLFQNASGVPTSEWGHVSTYTMTQFDAMFGIVSCATYGLARLTDAQVTTAISNGAVAVLDSYWDFPVGTEIPFFADNNSFVGRIELHYHPYGGSIKPWGYHHGVSVYYYSNNATRMSGSEFLEFTATMTIPQREDMILLQLGAKNIPDYVLPSLSSNSNMVAITATSTSTTRNVTFYTARDYLSIGTNEDFVRIPMAAYTAQKIADLYNCSLPTVKMVDLIWQHATYHLDPQPIPPSDVMCLNPVIEQENDLINTQLAALGNPASPYIGGDKKDTVLTNKYEQYVNNVAIYGWHYTTGEPIQPLYMGHSSDWADYSMGIRLVANYVHLDNNFDTPVLLADVLADEELAVLLSDEGAIRSARVPINPIPACACWEQ
jgi:hypothetical protein